MVFFCKRLLSDIKTFLACRTAKMSWDELRGDEKGWSVLGWDENSWEELTLMTCEKRWDEMRRDEKSRDEVRRAHVIWGETKCRVRSACVKCEVQGVKRALWSVRKVFAWRCIAPGSCAGHVLGQHLCNSFIQSTHARAWLAHGACKFYRWKRSYRYTQGNFRPASCGYYWYAIICIAMVHEMLYVSVCQCDNSRQLSSGARTLAGEKLTCRISSTYHISTLERPHIATQHSIEYPEILRIKFSWNLVCGVFITCQASNLRHGHIASACNQDQPLLIAGKQVLQARHRRLPQGWCNAKLWRPNLKKKT